MLCFLDDGEGMDPSKLIFISSQSKVFKFTGLQ